MQTTSNSQRNQWSGLFVIGMIITGGCGSETPNTPEVEKPASTVDATSATAPVTPTVPTPKTTQATPQVVEDKVAENKAAPVSLDVPTELPSTEPALITEPVTSSSVTLTNRVNATNVLPHSRILRVPTRDAEITAATRTFEDLQQAYNTQKPADYQAAEAKLLQFGPDAIPVLLDRLATTGSDTESSIEQELASMMLLQILPETLLIDPAFPKDLRIRVFQVMPEALSHPSNDVRINVATALSLFQDPPPQLVPALQKLLSSEAEHHRLMALVALGNLGPHSVIATTEIRSKLNDESPEVREAAKRTLDLMAAMPTSRQ